MDHLKICSYNCKNFRGPGRQSFIQELFTECDFLLLQEHWLYESQFSIFNDISPHSINFEGKSSMDPEVHRMGRPYGGVVIMWRANIELKVTPIPTNSSRLICVNISMSECANILLFNVYMPCDVGRNTENISEYQDVLAEISTLCVMMGPDKVCVGGDFNTDFGRLGSLHTKELVSFCETEDLSSCCLHSNSIIPYTYQCNATGSRSLIDHMLVSSNLAHLMNRCFTKDNVDNGSDHIAVIAEFEFPCHYFKQNNIKPKPRVAWYKARIHDIEQYKKSLDNALDGIEIPREACECRNVNCDEHQTIIETFHNNIIKACVNASIVLPHSGSSSASSTTSTRKPLPGWNDLCKEKREKAIFWHNMWKDAGRPREGHIANIRRRTRSQYHQSIRIAKKNEDKIRSEQLAKNIINNRNRDFWKEVKSLRGKSSSLPMSVDGAIGDQDISEVFASKFQTVFNSVSSDADALYITQTQVEAKVNEISPECTDQSLMTYSDLFDIIKLLKSGKSDGSIGLFSDHIIHGTGKLLNYLTLLFNGMLIHCLTPHDMLTGTMIPIPKGKRLNTNKSDNFRGICLQSHFCKLLDIFMLKKDSSTLQTSNNQFGFKQKLSASLATCVVTETVDYYHSRGGSVYGLALDASKAFDRVEFNKLFQTLLGRNFDPIHMRLLFNMYVNQKVRVRYNQTFSEYFTICNGVKQGGVISPTLFTCYIDGMLERLKSSGLGCNVGSAFTGCVSYADDLIILAPTVSALKGMIEICEEYANDHKIKFNGNKSKLMVFNRHGKFTPYIAVANEQVEQVPITKYLGHVLHADRSNSHTEDIRRDFVMKFNCFNGNFAQLSSVIKHNLFQSFCMSLYGINICDFQSHEMNAIYTEWRKAVRRIWKLPPRTHSRFLCHIIKSPPPDVLIMQRFINFFYSGILSDNDVVRFIFKQAKCSYSRLGCNLNFIMNRICLQACELEKYNAKTLCEAVFSRWFLQCSDEDVRTACQIEELIHMRDSYDTAFFTDNECQDILSYLCTIE